MSKIYCDECGLLEKRVLKAETFMDSGIYEVTGSRFYCPKADKNFSPKCTLDDVGKSWCARGQRGTFKDLT